jgi:hypothetical protein
MNQMTKIGVSRREWTAGLIAVPLVAQVASTPPKTPPETAAEPAGKSALDDVRQVGEKLAQIEVPMSVEPAFSFRA